MIRGDLIKAKSSHVAGEHHREMLALGKARAHDLRARARVVEREGRFWREIARASCVGNHKGGARCGERTEALNRALAAHHALSEAKGEQRHMASEVQHRIARVIKAKCLVSALDRLQAKERTVQAHKLAERRAEDVDAMVLLSRRAAPDLNVAPRSLPPLDRENGDVDMVEPEGGRLIPLEAGVTTPSPSLHVGEEGQRSSCHGEEPFARVPTVSLQEARAEATVDGAQLQMRMERGGTQLSCRLESTMSGHVGILMGAVDPTVVSSLERDRRGMMSRLGDAGIKVSGIDIRRDLTMPQAARGLRLRARQPNEEDDENVIA